MDLLVHGGALDRMRLAFPEAPEPWLDLSTGINPWPYPADVLPSHVLAHLPTESLYAECRKAMAAAIGGPPRALLPVPGTELVIRLLPHLLPDARTVAVLTPGYRDHVEAWSRAGRRVLPIADPFEGAYLPDVVVLSNPNNPDGRCWSAQHLLRLHGVLARRGATLIVDQAYADLSPDATLAAQGGADGLILLRSFGKFYGLAGVRLGALIGSADLLAQAEALLGHWSVSAPALWLGGKAYADCNWQKATRSRLADAATRLDGILSNAGLSIEGGTSLYRYARASDAERIWRGLAEAGIYIRRFEWSANYLRIGLPSKPEDEARLNSVLAALNP